LAPANEPFAPLGQDDRRKERSFAPKLF